MCSSVACLHLVLVFVLLLYYITTTHLLLRRSLHGLQEAHSRCAASSCYRATSGNGLNNNEAYTSHASALKDSEHAPCNDRRHTGLS
jgi:hypothetical protein